MRLRPVLSWAALVFVALGWSVFLRPTSFGGTTTFVGVSGVSMTPTMHDGDLAFVRKRSTYQVGDVIAYRIPAGDPGAGHNIIHRIVGGDADRGFVTRGDYNKGDDIWQPTGGDVLGEVVVHVPNAAGWLGQLRRPGVLAAVVGLVTFLIMVRRDRQQAADEADHSTSDLPAPVMPAAVTSVPVGTGGTVRVGTAIAVTAAVVAAGALRGRRSATPRGRARRSRYSGSASRV
jgi:signal peptidase I